MLMIFVEWVEGGKAGVLYVDLGIENRIGHDKGVGVDLSLEFVYAIIEGYGLDRRLEQSGKP